MGHLANALGIRLGISRRWPMKGISRFGHLCEELSIALFDLIHKKYNSRLFQQYGILFSHSLVSFKPQSLHIKIFIYDSRFELFLNRFYLRLRKREFTSLTKRLPYNSASFFKPSDVLLTRYISYINKDLIRGNRYLRRLFFNTIRIPVHKFFLQHFLTFLSYRMFKFDIIPYSTISIVSQPSSMISARAIANYAIRKLRTFNSLNDIFPLLIRGFSTITAGISIMCSGRFTKRQRASLIRYRAGKTPYSLYSTPLDFCSDIAILKYGVGSIKIWITKHQFKPKPLIKDELF